jgi:hypothetical protein
VVHPLKRRMLFIQDDLALVLVKQYFRVDPGLFLELPPIHHLDVFPILVEAVAVDLGPRHAHESLVVKQDHEGHFEHALILRDFHQIIHILEFPCGLLVPAMFAFDVLLVVEEQFEIDVFQLIGDVLSKALVVGKYFGLLWEMEFSDDDFHDLLDVGLEVEEEFALLFPCE